MSRTEDADVVGDWFQAAVSLLHAVQNPNLHYSDPGRPGREARQLLADETMVSVRDALARLSEEDAPTESSVDPGCYVAAAVPLLVAMAPMDFSNLADNTAKVIRALIKGTAMALTPEPEADA